MWNPPKRLKIIKDNMQIWNPKYSEPSQVNSQGAKIFQEKSQGANISQENSKGPWSLKKSSKRQKYTKKLQMGQDLFF